MVKRHRRLLPPYVVEDVAKATGQVRLYYRRPGQKKIRIWPSVEQVGFWPAYEAAKRGERLPKPSTEIKRSPFRQKTFAALCNEYFGSAAFHQLAESSQRTRRGILQRCCQEETRIGSGLLIGDTPITEFGTKHIAVLRDRKGSLPEAANGRVKAIRAVFAWHQEGIEGARNPCTGLKKLKPKNIEGFHSWSMDEVAAFEAKHAIGTNARLAFDLALYSSQRKSDVVRLGPAHVSLINGIAWLTLHQQKTGARVEIPIIEPLATSIAERPFPSGSTFLVTSFGKPFTGNGLGNAFRTWCDEAGLPHCSMHGLRKATASRLAELGVDEHGIAAVTGHELGSSEMARYTRAARRRLMAGNAMKKLEDSLPTRREVPCKLSHLENADVENGTIAEEKLA